MQKRLQRGFVHSRVMDLVFLFVLILAGLVLVKVFETLISGDYTVAFFVIWLLASAAAWWWCHEQRLLLRVPTGLWIFFVAGSVFIPLSWWTQSRLVAGVEAAVAVTLARYLGWRCSRLIAAKMAEGTPWYLDQGIDLIADLGRWVFACIIAWFAVGVLPLLLVVILPVEWIPWGAMAWGFAATAWYLFKFRTSRLRLLKLPIGLWVFAVTAVVLKLFQQQIAGPMEAGSIELIAYSAYWPVVSALFIEITIIGTSHSNKVS